MKEVSYSKTQSYMIITITTRSKKIADYWIQDFEGKRDINNYMRTRFERYPEAFKGKKIIVAKMIGEYLEN